MDVSQDQHNPATGDDELAKVLAGVSDNASGHDMSLQFEETPAPGVPSQNKPVSTPTHQAAAAAANEATAVPVSVSTPAANTTYPTNDNLETIKRSALEELRPLVDKLNLPPEEKFDTLLLIIRSTDDQDLVEAAHEAAKNISDEAKRAQALLDVIKEIDYFSSAHQPQ